MNVDPSLTQMLDQFQSEIETLNASFVALAVSVIPMLPIKVGQRMTIAGGQAFVADSIKFDPCAYYVAGKWKPGFSVFGTRHDGRHRIVLDLAGREVSRTTPALQ